MVEDHYRLKRLEMALSATAFLRKTTRICFENMPKTTRLATLFKLWGPRKARPVYCRVTPLLSFVTREAALPERQTACCGEGKVFTRQTHLR